MKNAHHIVYIVFFSLLGALIGLLVAPGVTSGPEEAVRQTAIRVLLGAIAGAAFGKLRAAAELPDRSITTSTSGMQYSLRSLLILVTLTCVALGVVMGIYHLL